MTEKEKRIIRWLLLGFFLFTFVLFALVGSYGFFTQVSNPSIEIPLLNYVIGAVAVETVACISALWSSVFSLREKPADTVAQPVNVDIVVTKLAKGIEDFVVMELRERNVRGAVEKLAMIRDAVIGIREDMYAKEVTLRCLLGHSSFLSSSVRKLGPTYAQQALVEVGLLAYAIGEALPDGFDEIHAEKNVRDLWFSLRAIESLSRGNFKEVNRFYSKISHNLDGEGVPRIAKSDPWVAYRAIMNAIVAASLKQPRVAETYLEIAKSSTISKANSSAKSFEYPYMFIVSDLHRGFILSLLGVTYEMDKNWVQSTIPGHARVMARHCHVLIDSEVAMSTIADLGKTWKSLEGFSAVNIKDRVRHFENMLLECGISIEVPKMGA